VQIVKCLRSLIYVHKLANGTSSQAERCWREMVTTVDKSLRSTKYFKA